MDINKEYKEEIKFIVEQSDKNLPEILREFAEKYHEEQLLIHGVVKSLKAKQTLNFRDWTEENDIGLDENGKWFISGKGDVDIDTLIDMHVRDVYL